MNDIRIRQAMSDLAAWPQWCSTHVADVLASLGGPRLPRYFDQIGL